MSVQVHHGDSRTVLPTLAADSIDSVVTDPPYSLVSIQKRFGKPGSAPAQHGKDGAYARAARGFMGKQWDTGETAFDPAFWAEVYRVLKPGAHLIAFGGTRTYHRLACAIEDAGFEIRDQIGWLFGSGFPKSHDAERAIAIITCPLDGRHFARTLPPEDKRKPGDHICPITPESAPWDGFGTSLKPAWESICLARKPLIGTVAANVLAHGTGAINVDGCRVATADESTVRNNHGGTGNPEHWRTGNGGDFTSGSTQGRWPANVIHDGSDEVLEAFARYGESVSKQAPRGGTNPNPMDWGNGRSDGHIAKGHSDSGSPARYFYSAKADTSDRLGSKHPTVKPVDLMAYLCRLVTPPGGTVLDPFAGSGTTGMACLREGFDAILIEREAEYYTDILKRIAHVEGADTPLFAEYDAALDSRLSYDLALQTMRENPHLRTGSYAPNDSLGNVAELNATTSGGGSPAALSTSGTRPPAARALAGQVR